MVLFENVLREWYEFGLLDVIIPFVLVFTIVYAILQKTRVLGSTKDGKPKNNINAMLAFVVGFTVIATLQIVNVITILSQYFVLATIAITLVVIIAALMGIKSWKKTKLPLIIGSVITLIIAIYALGFNKKINLGFFDQRIVPIVLGLLLVCGIIYYITKGAEKKPAKKAEKKKEEKKTEKKPAKEDEESDIEDFLGNATAEEKDQLLKQVLGGVKLKKK